MSEANNKNVTMKRLLPIVFISRRRQFLHRDPSGAYEEPVTFDPSDEEVPHELFEDEYEETIQIPTADTGSNNNVRSATATQEMDVETMEADEQSEPENEAEKRDQDFIPFDEEYKATEEWKDYSAAMQKKRRSTRTKAAPRIQAEPIRAAKVIVTPKKRRLPYATVTVTPKNPQNESKQ